MKEKKIRKLEDGIYAVQVQTKFTKADVDKICEKLEEDGWLQSVVINKKKVYSITLKTLVLFLMFLQSQRFQERIEEKDVDYVG
jgi:hypothetical protein